ncbi:MAG: DUF5667 domain-containing protein [Candidatus Levybacteria bacterium]|nr:DUF5667 domain-containing protein [Candidatus Levybacteria bacterium]
MLLPRFIIDYINNTQIKKSALHILIILFSLFIFPIVQTSFAEESTQSTIIKYDLAYPGILPDNPLYKLKVVRDKIVASLISDPNKKIEFYLLQTDKGILATAMLIDNNKVDLALQTALKAENNYTLLTQQLYKFRQKPNANFFKKLKTASLKHQEVLASLIKRVPEKNKQAFTNIIYFSQRNLETIEEYRIKQ